MACSCAAMAGSAVLAMAVSSDAMPTPIATDSMAQPRAPAGKPSCSAAAAGWLEEDKLVAVGADMQEFRCGESEAFHCPAILQDVQAARRRI